MMTKEFGMWLRCQNGYFGDCSPDAIPRPLDRFYPLLEKENIARIPDHTEKAKGPRRRGNANL